jgi:hypothetical protein
MAFVIALLNPSASPLGASYAAHLRRNFTIVHILSGRENQAKIFPQRLTLSEFCLSGEPCRAKHESGFSLPTVIQSNPP